MDNLNKPLEGLLVLEFSQFLAGPSAGLRLADLGARVIKIERPQGGDACRKLVLKNLWVGDDSLLFHTINRNKESYTADLKKTEDLDAVKALIKQADILTHNFRPGVMEKIGLDYGSVKTINPALIYAEVTGYGKVGPWKDKPGQDLLLQSLSGLSHLSGNSDSPQPFGLAIADIMCGAHLVQGILAALIQRTSEGEGAHVEVSLMESILDFQFEFLTTWFNGGGLPVKSNINHAHALLSAPYGIYQTKDGYIALAMSDLKLVGLAAGLPSLIENTQDPFEDRDLIKERIAARLIEDSNEYWLGRLSEYKLWVMPVLNWKQLREEPAYQSLKMEQELTTSSGQTVRAVRGAIHIDGQPLYSSLSAPILGENTEAINKEFSLV
ncbi:MAG TPA: CaiB/BaiF CoA-transferase family protein [Cytophagaceae bacterium]